MITFWATAAQRSLTVSSALLLLTSVSHAADQAPPLFSFVPNQLAANTWYRPGTPPSLINGHLDESFGHSNLWPVLLRNLQTNRGSFSIFAAEIGYLSSKSGLLPLLRSKHIPISVEMPGFTQGIDGSLLANAEISGMKVNGDNIFASIFGIKSPTDRTNPDGVGWFVTRDGSRFIPDEIIFDERIPNLLPELDPDKLVAATGAWEMRKDAARKPNGYAHTSMPYRQLMANLMQDYVKFLTVAKQHWGSKMPAVSLHWNVNPGWEWRDETGIDAIHAADEGYFNVAGNFWAIVTKRPQYNSVIYLNELVDVLTAAGFKPRTVYMDVDWTYSIPYIAETMRRHKPALKSRGVQMGINVVEASIGDNEKLMCDGETLRRTAATSEPINQMYEDTLTALMRFLTNSGIYEKGFQIRVGSWSHRPYEAGSNVDESIPGSMAHTANCIIKLR